ncbi:Ctf18p ASCRUDRAFT_7627 [Ascoidea rubescens DSM 1968]|uniref:AAA+ ATPase domain-containing protein n=1 Tax=Ascoidea rubescens DSM 1968 TaxID=1344418 RepID=A0A1D2VIM4_9ASCO|nr:hypothetical protein ASCRUDRAFT_7627 [Ascoidea rubescens DSM 1968]ODV61390.1 hypothetical protein ASCRUDRAFT_7627 [Ascoidea rubescens DSM 1968]
MAANNDPNADIQNKRANSDIKNDFKTFAVLSGNQGAPSIFKLPSFSNSILFENSQIAKNTNDSNINPDKNSTNGLLDFPDFLKHSLPIIDQSLSSHNSYPDSLFFQNSLENQIEQLNENLDENLDSLPELNTKNSFSLNNSIDDVLKNSLNSLDTSNISNPFENLESPNSNLFKTKSVKLFNNKTIKLRSKININISDSSILNKKNNLVNQNDSIINIDTLFKNLEISNIYKKNRLNNLKKLNNSNQLQNTSSKNSLFVDKYRPKSFLDLIGNEKQNRSILKWLNQWNHCAFNNQSDLYKHDNNHNNNNNNNNMEIDDPFNRPNKKILLINGPPGTGKTTISHLIGKQLGYEILEINASDERSGVRVKEKLLNLLNNNLLNAKPLLLICDEIDGASEIGFINILLNIVQNDDKLTKQLIQLQLQNQNKNKLKNSKKKFKFILRPIITICNDLYSPVLEKLRNVSEIVTFKKISSNLIKSRLKRVCDLEKMAVSNKGELLDEIIELSNNDIRSSLNLLQFKNNAIKHGFNVNSDFENINENNYKDINIPVFRLNNLIFKRNITKNKIENYNKLKGLLNYKVGNINIEKLNNNLFKTFPKFNDNNRLFNNEKSFSKVLDWINFNDYLSKSRFQLNSNSMGGGEDLIKYLYDVPLVFFEVFNDFNNNNSNISSTVRGNMKQKENDNEDDEWEISNRNKRNKMMISKFLDGNSKMIMYCNGLKKRDLVIEFLPYIYNFMLKIDDDFNEHSKEFKSKVQKVIEIMNILNISISYNSNNGDSDQEFNKNGYFFEFEPNFKVITLFGKQKNKNTNPRITRLVKNEIRKINEQKEKEKMTELKKRKATDSRYNEREITLKSSKNKDNDSNSEENESDRKRKKVTVMDFFKNSYHLEENKASKDKQKSDRIWIKYHEGFTNAVRKNVLWKDLF